METSAQIYMLIISGCLLFLKPFRELLFSNYVKLVFFLLACSWLIPVFSGSIHERFHPMLSMANNAIFFLFLPLSYTSIYQQLHKKETASRYSLYLVPLLLASLLCIFIYSIHRIFFSSQPVLLWYSLLVYITVGAHLYFIV